MKRVLLALFALLIALPSWGASFVINQMKVQPGFFTAGVRVFCAGVIDTNAYNLRCELKVRKAFPATEAEKGYSLGTNCLRRIGFSNAFDGILTGLTPGVQYYVWAAVYCNSESQGTEQAFTTRVYNFSVTGPLVYVNGNPNSGGDDANTCGPDDPCLTVAHAEAVLVAKPNQGRGGGIVLQPGVYRENTQIGVGGNSFAVGTAGGHATPDTLYHLMSDGTNPDSTIIDCSEQRSLTWSDGADVGDSIWVAKYFNAKTQAARSDSIAMLIRGWGDYYPYKYNWQELKRGVIAGGAGLADGLSTGQRGWMYSPNHDSIYVKTPDGLTPGSTQFHFGYRAGVYFLHPYWAISNLVIRGGRGAAINYGTGNGFNRGSGCVLDSVKIIGAQTSGVYPTSASSQAGYTDSILVRNCVIDGLRGYNIPLGALWGRLGHGHGIQFSSGFANTVYNTTVKNWLFGYEGYNDAISSVAGDSVEASDNYLGFNQFIDNSNSGIDVNGQTVAWGSINAIFEQNLVKGRPFLATDKDPNYFPVADVGFLLVNLPNGPEWLIRNHCYGTGHGIFYGSTGSAKSTVVLYHNTIAGEGSSIRVDPGNSGRLISRNNLFMCQKKTGEPTGGPNSWAAVDVGGATLNELSLFDFDYDALDYTAVNFAQVRWGPVYGDLSYVQANAPVEPHGLVARYGAVDSTSTSGFPAATTNTATTMDLGQSLFGINTPIFGVNRCSGLAPDIGAYEYAVPADSLHMPLNPRNRLWMKK